MDNKLQLDKRLEPFIGNNPNHVGYCKSFECADFLMSTDKLVSIMRAFTEEIQEAVNFSEESRI